MFNGILSHDALILRTEKAESKTKTYLEMKTNG